MPHFFRIFFDRTSKSQAIDGPWWGDLLLEKFESLSSLNRRSTTTYRRARKVKRILVYTFPPPLAFHGIEVDVNPEQVT